MKRKKKDRRQRDRRKMTRGRGEEGPRETEIRGKERRRETTECISALATETRDERRSALEDTDTFVREDTKK